MKIPFARVNHAKFMVTDRVVYIGACRLRWNVPSFINIYRGNKF